MAVGLHSCTPIFHKWYGIEALNEFDQEKYQKTLEELSLMYPGPLLSYVGRDSMFREYSLLDTTFGTATIQPIQVLYFERNTLKSFQANCYAKGSLLGTLDWNYDGRFDSFFPKSAINIEDKKLSLLDVKEIFQIHSKAEDFTVVFFWTHFLKRESLRAFEEVVKNIEASPTDKKPTVFLINTDEAFLTPDE